MNIYTLEDKLKSFFDYIGLEIDEINKNIEIDGSGITHRIEYAKKQQTKKVADVLYDLIEKDIYPFDSNEIKEKKFLLWILQKNLKEKKELRNHILYNNALPKDEKKEQLKPMNKELKRLKKAINNHQKELYVMNKKEESEWQV
jgi:hypothetical protein